MKSLSIKDLFETGVSFQTVSVPSDLAYNAESLGFQDTHEKYNDSNSPLLSVDKNLEIIKFWLDFIDQYEKPFVDIFGLFTTRLYCAHLYRQGDGLEWHSDCSSKFPLNHILYLGESEWHRSYGGYLSVRKEGSQAVEILPVHGTLVSLLNWNPLFQHKVERLKIPLKRISLMLKSGY
jgi:hypothetical protein